MVQFVILGQLPSGPASSLSPYTFTNTYSASGAELWRQVPPTAVDPEMAAESPKKPLVAPSVAVSPACWDQAVPERVSTCAAPVPGLWQGAPATVVDPETATE